MQETAIALLWTTARVQAACSCTGGNGASSTGGWRLEPSCRLEGKGATRQELTALNNATKKRCRYLRGSQCAGLMLARQQVCSAVIL